MAFDKDYYPMNQDRISIDQIIYNGNVEWLSGFVRRQAEMHEMTHDAVIAQVEKDLRMILDQKMKPT
jgi:hypothetical protein